LEEGNASSADCWVLATVKEDVIFNRELRCGTGWLRRVISERLWFDRLRRDDYRQKQEPAKTASVSRQVAGFHDFPPHFFCSPPSCAMARTTIGVKTSRETAEKS
jgi:hypothetical protein